MVPADTVVGARHWRGRHPGSSLGPVWHWRLWAPVTASVGGSLGPWRLRGAGAGGGRCPWWQREDSTHCLEALRLASVFFPCHQQESGLIGLSSSALSGVYESLASSALVLE